MLRATDKRISRLRASHGVIPSSSERSTDKLVVFMNQKAPPVYQAWDCRNRYERARQNAAIPGNRGGFSAVSPIPVGGRTHHAAPDPSSACATANDYAVQAPSENPVASFSKEPYPYATVVVAVSSPGPRLHVHRCFALVTTSTPLGRSTRVMSSAMSLVITS